MSQALRVRDLYGSPVSQRQADGYVNATELCKAAGKQWADYWRLAGSQEFIQALVDSTGIPSDTLVEMRSGRGGGTWVHPHIAVNLAQWCSPRFAVQVSQWVQELLSTGSVTVATSGTGDQLLDHIMTIRETATALVEVRQRQLAQDREIKTVRGIAERAEETAVAALHVAGNHHGYLSVLGYCNLSGRELTEQQARECGKELSAICRAKGITVNRTGNERYGFVNTYPVSVLRQYFGDKDDPLDLS